MNELNPPAITRQVRSLEVLEAEVDAVVDVIFEKAPKVSKLKLGRLLLEAKERCHHGLWQNWVFERGITNRTARRYMELAGLANEDGLGVDADPTYQDVGMDDAEDARKTTGVVENGQLAVLDSPPNTDDKLNLPPDAGQFDSITRELLAIKKSINAIASAPVGRYLLHQQAVSCLDDCLRELKFARPHTVCPYCYPGGGKCQGCGGAGWVGRRQWDGAPNDLKEVVTGR